MSENTMQIRPEQIDPDAAKVLQRLRRYDHLAYAVGGCVRDLLLGLKPKDFDIATSATPPELRRLFRNCRIIGRRFRLAHIFFGNKIIETSTFRSNPRENDELEDTSGAAAAEPENSDLLIRRDNVFGTAEEDARRRDFTINGLFYDIETGKVIDHVNGMPDLEARVVRTIGDPDIRFREDPIRILRAVKFAARCSLTIEPETYQRMLEHTGEIAKCPQARVSEEFFRLLRGGAAKRSMELLVQTDILRILAPELAAALASPDRDAGSDADAQVSAESRLKRGRLWAYLAALDRSTERRPNPPSNALILATVLLAPLRDALHPDTNTVKNVGHLVLESIKPLLESLKASRRDAELSRQILLALRYIFPSSNPNRRRPRLAGREFFDDALRLSEIVADAEALDPSLAGKPLLADGENLLVSPDDESAPELEPLDEGGRPDRRRGRDRGRSRDRGDSSGRANEGEARSEAGGSNGREMGRGREREHTGESRDLPRVEGTLAPRPLAGGDGKGWVEPMRAPGSLTPIPALPGWMRSQTDRPGFLGRGTFGGPWSVSSE